MSGDGMSLIQGEEMEPAIVEKLAHPLVLAQDGGNCLGEPRP